MIYGSLPVQTITYITVVVTTTTVFLCYGLAVGLGHVPAWLPMISDCAVEPPEKYPFRFGIISGATALFANVFLVYWAFPNFSLRKFSTAMGAIASIGLAIAAAVNEEENNTVHSVAAIIFFLFYDIYMTIIAFNSPTDRRISSISIINKKIFALLGIVLLVAAAAFAALGQDKYKIGIPICEWAGFLGIEAFNLTFAFDLKGLTLEEVSKDGGEGSLPLYSELPDCKDTVQVKKPL
eukprot:m.62828 g.62828  ORF g.62828 m.62828 type:complete len:237 (+) comp35111_c0_seq2:80-790(+)